MNFLGIDPAMRSGLAYRTRDGWITVTYDMRIDRTPALQFFQEAKAAGVTDAIIEDGYRGRNVSFKGVKVVSEIRGWFQCACDVAGLDYLVVAPATWQAAMLSQWGRATRDERKAASRFSAEQLGAVCRTQDEADAVNIAEYGNLFQRMEQRARRGA